MYPASSIYTSGDRDTPKSSLMNLANVAYAERDSHSKGSSFHKEETWLNLVKNLNREKNLGIFEKPSYQGFTRLLTHMETEYIPYLVHNSCVNEGQFIDEALNEAQEVAFFARQRVVAEFIDNATIPESDRVRILMAHFLLSNMSIEIGVFENRKIRHVDTLRNEMFGALVDYGIDRGADFDDLVRVVGALQEKQFLKVREYARQYEEDVRDGISSAGASFYRGYAPPFQKFSKRTTNIINGMKGEIYSAWLLRHMAKGLGIDGLEVCKASAEADIHNDGDFFVVRNADPSAAEVDVVFVVDAKNIQGYEPEFQIIIPDGRVLGKKIPSKTPNPTMVAKARRNGTMLIVLRNPIHRVNVSVAGFEDPKSYPAITGNTIRTILGSEENIG
jgi:hypothetical protein